MQQIDALSLGFVHNVLVVGGPERRRQRGEIDRDFWRVSGGADGERAERGGRQCGQNKGALRLHMLFPPEFFDAVFVRGRSGDGQAVVRGSCIRALARVDIPYFCIYRNMEGSFVPKSDAEATTARYADMLAALGAEPRLRIVRVLLAAHPEGLVVGEIGSELGIPPSTLSHHLEKLKNEGLVAVRRESTFLRYTADTATFRNRLASCSPSATPAAGDQTRSRYLRPRMKGAM